ncbi:MAG TPA: DUF2911 domain-containing protein [Terriglobia bacterium]|nr:DUF2911 domain-containing protein [Terriglobia bacterium]
MVRIVEGGARTLWQLVQGGEGPGALGFQPGKGTTVKASSTVILLTCAALGAVALRGQQPSKPLSPRGTAATQVGSTWVAQKPGVPPQYPGGKWIEVDYGRPILHGRQNIFGSGADYGKTVNAGAPVWRAGAGSTTKLTTEVPIVIGGKTLKPGVYDLFVELREGAWTLILGTQPTQDTHDPKEKTAIWGAYGYDPKFDVARAPMTVTKLEHSVDQLTIGFLDMSDSGGKLGMEWDTTGASAAFSIAR